MKIDEGIVDVLVNTLKYNAVVYDRGNWIEFRVKMPFSKSEITLKITTLTFTKFRDWINSI